MTGYKSKKAAAQDKMKCQCSMTTSLVGSGCQYCNPEYMDDEAQPPQRPWVGLEGEKIRYLWERATKPDRSTMTIVTSFAQAIEAALRIKNT